mmetsp:Transcript_127489/g.369085  ORF Transcript_127489/g.369085 Transcript_127489/m.369085 type:complete len:189 (+) Transcript_127489:92-658(+)
MLAPRFLGVVAAALLHAAAAGDVVVGSRVFFTVPRTGRRLTTEGNGYMHAHWNHTGPWQRFVVEEVTPLADSDGTLTSGTKVQLKAWTGGYVGHEDTLVAARDLGLIENQQWTIALAEGGDGPIQSGSLVIFRDASGVPMVVDDPEHPGGITVAPTEDMSKLKLIIESTPSRGAAPTPTPAPTTTILP